MSRREHSRAELFDRFRRRADEDALNRLLDELAAAGYQSDDRFAESFVRSRIQRGQGPLRIAADLNQRGCSRALVDAYLHRVERDWSELAREALRKRFGYFVETDEKPVLGPRAFGQAGRFLASRGFPAALINQLVERTFSDDLPDVEAID